MRLECEWHHARKGWTENLRILKKKPSWEIEIGPCMQTIESLPLGHRELSSLPLRHIVGVLQISIDRDLKHHGMRSAFVGSDSMVSTVRIVSLSSCRRIEVRINKPFVPEATESACVFVFVCIWICICSTVVIDIIMVVVYNNTSKYYENIAKLLTQPKHFGCHNFSEQCRILRFSKSLRLVTKSINIVKIAFLVSSNQ